MTANKRLQSFAKSLLSNEKLKLVAHLSSVSCLQSISLPSVIILHQQRFFPYAGSSTPLKPVPL